MQYLLVLPLVLASIAVLCLVQWRKSLDRLPYPPGPSPHPLIGNILQMPKVNPWLKYAEWQKEFGDVISMGAFGNRVVVVNSAKAASEIFEKRGTIYSERPHNVMIQDLMETSGIFFIRSSETLRLWRKMITTAMNPTAVMDYTHIQEQETYYFLARMVGSPGKYYQHVRRAAGAIILKITYGHTVKTDDDYYVQTAYDTVMHLRGALQPNSFLVNFIPALKHIPPWMPFAGFRSFARKGSQANRNLREVPYNMVKSQMLAGVAPLSYASKLLEAAESAGTSGAVDEENIKMTASALFTAGTNTTVSSIITFILVMILHPEVQRKAQAELDALVGGSRLPTIADRSSLPYLECVMLEVLRWQPVNPLGLPRAMNKDDVYEGYFIPKNSVVLCNIWAIMHDEKMYMDPMKFWPERFDGRFPDIKDPRLFIFGVGRRSCLGRHLALNSIFISMACLLSTYNISKARDCDGREIEPVHDYSPGSPKPFECRITPRSEEAVTLIKAAAEM